MEEPLIFLPNGLTLLLSDLTTTVVLLLIALGPAIYFAYLSEPISQLIEYFKRPACPICNKPRAIKKTVTNENIASELILITTFACTKCKHVLTCYTT